MSWLRRMLREREALRGIPPITDREIRTQVHQGRWLIHMEAKRLVRLLGGEEDPKPWS